MTLGVVQPVSVFQVPPRNGGLAKPYQGNAEGSVGDHPRDLAALTFGESGGLLSVLQALGDLPADMMEHPLPI